jgi:hypothetical protein
LFNPTGKKQIGTRFAGKRPKITPITGVKSEGLQVLKIEEPNL